MHLLFLKAKKKNCYLDLNKKFFLLDFILEIRYYFQLILHFKSQGRFIIDTLICNFELNFLVCPLFLGGCCWRVCLIWSVPWRALHTKVNIKIWTNHKMKEKMLMLLPFFCESPPKSMCSSLRTVCYISASGIQLS